MAITLYFVVTWRIGTLLKSLPENFRCPLLLSVLFAVTMEKIKELSFGTGESLIKWSLKFSMNRPADQTASILPFYNNSRLRVSGKDVLFAREPSRDDLYFFVTSLTLISEIEFVLESQTTRESSTNVHNAATLLGIDKRLYDITEWFTKWSLNISMRWESTAWTRTGNQPPPLQLHKDSIVTLMSPFLPAPRTTSQCGVLATTAPRPPNPPHTDLHMKSNSSSSSRIILPSSPPLHPSMSVRSDQLLRLPKIYLQRQLTPGRRDIHNSSNPRLMLRSITMVSLKIFPAINRKI